MPKVVAISKRTPRPPQTRVDVIETYPMPNGSITASEVGAFLADPTPFLFEVVAWATAYARAKEIKSLQAEIADQAETLERLRRLLGGAGFRRTGRTTCVYRGR
jgi:hypothetical protein